MSNLLDKQILAMETELTALKSARLRSAAEMSTKYKEITVTAEICGWNDGTYMITAPTKAGVARLTLPNAAFVCWSLATDPGYRRVMIRPRTDDNGNYELLAYVQYGSPNDAQDLAGNSGNKKSISIKLGVVATCDFTYTTYQTEDYTG